MGFDVMAADIQNAYLQAPTNEKYWTTCGPEFGTEESGKLAIIVRALYGIKSSGRYFRNHLRNRMEHLGYTSCRDDPYLWMHKAVRSNWQYDYEYLLFYVDNYLAFIKNPTELLQELDKYFPIKPGSVGPPKLYLGAKVSKTQLPNGVESYAVSTRKYAQEAVKNVEQHLTDKIMRLNRGVTDPLSPGYIPEIDASPELELQDATYYQSFIGIIRWMVEMGRINITCEVLMMS